LSHFRVGVRPNVEMIPQECFDFDHLVDYKECTTRPRSQVSCLFLPFSRRCWFPSLTVALFSPSFLDPIVKEMYDGFSATSSDTLLVHSCRGYIFQLIFRRFLVHESIRD